MQTGQGNTIVQIEEFKCLMQRQSQKYETHCLDWKAKHLKHSIKSRKASPSIISSPKTGTSLIASKHTGFSFCCGIFGNRQSKQLLYFAVHSGKSITPNPSWQNNVEILLQHDRQLISSWRTKFFCYLWFRSVIFTGASFHVRGKLLRTIVYLVTS
jgi:hypothetical protein